MPTASVAGQVQGGHRATLGHTLSVVHAHFCLFSTRFAGIFLVIPFLLGASGSPSKCVSSKFILDGSIRFPQSSAPRSNVPCSPLPLVTAHNSSARLHRMLILRFLPLRSILLSGYMCFRARLSYARAVCLPVFWPVLHAHPTDPTVYISSSDCCNWRSSTWSPAKSGMRDNW